MWIIDWWLYLLVLLQLLILVSWKEAWIVTEKLRFLTEFVRSYGWLIGGIINILILNLVSNTIEVIILLLVHSIWNISEGFCFSDIKLFLITSFKSTVLAAFFDLLAVIKEVFTVWIISLIQYTCSIQVNVTYVIQILSSLESVTLITDAILHSIAHTNNTLTQAIVTATSEARI